MLDVVTESGTTYLIDGDTITRIHGTNGDNSSGTLRRDGDTLKILKWIRRPKIGDPMTFWLEVRDDGVPTIRTTTPVIRITMMLEATSAPGECD